MIYEGSNSSSLYEILENKNSSWQYFEFLYVNKKNAIAVHFD